MTRARLLGGCGVILAASAWLVANFHWPEYLRPWTGPVGALGASIILFGLRGVKKALKDRQIDAALGSDHAE